MYFSLENFKFGRLYVSNTLLVIAVMNFSYTTLKNRSFFLAFCFVCIDVTEDLGEKFIVEEEVGESSEFLALQITGHVWLHTLSSWVLHIDRGVEEGESEKH